MEKITAEKLVEFNNEFEIYENYSGRGMYGKTTYGVQVDSLSDLIGAAFQLGLHCNSEESSIEFSTETEIIEEDLHNLNWDNLGRRIIVY